MLQCHGSFATASCINCHNKVPGSDIEQEIMDQVVPLCKVCNDSTGKPVVSSKNLKKKASKKKRNAAPWEVDSEEEPDVPLYPPGIMKVIQNHHRLNSIHSLLDLSRISHSLARNLPTTSTKHSSRTGPALIYFL